MSRATEQGSTHRDAGHNRALVLAAGEGSRLQALTTTASGIAVPKQFCSLGGGASLLHDALRRARVVAPPERTCAAVAAHHRRWWEGLSRSIPTQNIVERCASQLQVLDVPACGWSDLGTPQRVAQILDRAWPWLIKASSPEPLHAGGFLNLAARHARLQTT